MRYVHLPGAAVDTALLEDATRRGTHTFKIKFDLVERDVVLTNLHHNYRSCSTSIESKMKYIRWRSLAALRVQEKVQRSFAPIMMGGSQKFMKQRPTSWQAVDK